MNKVLLIQVDGKMPNLALMKISTWHKKLGNKVFLNESCNPDFVYISCIFTKNRPKALGIAKMFPKAKIWLGGSGINYNTLPNKIEHLMPDYDLYGIDYSIGFTSRGCFRKCPFCIVPNKEGMMRNNAPITEFLHPNHKKLVLLDNNLLGSPKWEDNLQFIIDNKLKVSFNQGLDARIVNDDNLELLSKCLYYDWKFKSRRVYFAWDLMKDERQILEGIEKLFEYIPKRHLMFYVLCGFDTTFKQDMYRVKKLRGFGIEPFIMKFNGRRDIRKLNEFARWVNFGLKLGMRKVPFEKWCEMRNFKE